MIALVFIFGCCVIFAVVPVLVALLIAAKAEERERQQRSKEWKDKLP